MNEFIVKCRPDVAAKKIKVFGSYNYINGNSVSGRVDAAPVPDVIQLHTSDSGTTLVFNYDESTQIPRIILPYDDVPDGAYFEVKTVSTRNNRANRATALHIMYTRKTGEEVGIPIAFGDVEVIYSAVLDLWLLNQGFNTTFATGTIYDGWGNQTDSFGRFVDNGNTYTFNQVTILPNGAIVPTAGTYRS